MTARIPKTELRGVRGRLVQTMTRRMFGEVPEALQVMWNHPDVVMTSAGFGRKVQKWNQADTSLKTFAHMAVASLIGCSWCLDYNYYEAHNKGLDMDKAREIPRWRESDIFTPLERQVLDYAEAMSQTPPTVTDEAVAALLADLGPAGLIELTNVIGFANLTSRGNVALGIEAQGFAAACQLRPLAERSRAEPLRAVASQS